MHAFSQSVRQRRRNLMFLCRQRLAQRFQGAQRLIVRGFLANHAIAGQRNACRRAIRFPIAHPFAIPPAIRAKQRHLFARKAILHGLKHRQKFAVLQFFRTHRRAAESNCLVLRQLFRPKLRRREERAAEACATASAMACVLPVPDQYTTATLPTPISPFFHDLDFHDLERLGRFIPYRSLRSLLRTNG